MKYKSKPKEIEAVRWDGSEEAFHKLLEMGCAFTRGLGHSVKIHTLEGVMIGGFGDYIIKGIKGEFYPIRADIFHASYEEIK